MDILFTLQRIKLLFSASVVTILVLLFVLSVSLRSEELALLNAAGRSLSALGYRAQFALSSLYMPGDSSSLFSQESAQGVPVLVYHGIVVKPDRFSLTESAFKDHMFALKRAGYSTVTLAEFEAFLQGEAELPAKSFVLTFDDGRRDSFERADPILEALGFTAVMFVATDASLGPPESHNDYYLSERELKTMLANGRWEIGSHAVQEGGGFVAVDAAGTKGNFLSNKKWLPAAGRVETNSEYAARVARELSESKQTLEERFGVSVRSFSYPFGDWGQQSDNAPNAPSIIARVMRDSYAFAFQQVWPLDNNFSANYSGMDPYHLVRIEPETGWSGGQLADVVKVAEPKPLPFSDAFEARAGWKHNWGIVEEKEGLLALAASSTGGGSLAFLDGTYHWRDYLYTAEVGERRGFVSLIARYQDGDNMALCTFGGNSVRVTQKVGGVQATLAERSARVPTSGVRFGVLVEGTRVACTQDGEVIAVASLDRALAQGGIGVRVWSDVLGAASLTLDTLEAIPVPE